MNTNNWIILIGAIVIFFVVEIILRYKRKKEITALEKKIKFSESRLVSVRENLEVQLTEAIAGQNKT